MIFYGFKWVKANVTFSVKSASPKWVWSKLLGISGAGIF